MAFVSTKIPYQQTGFYSTTVTDYLANADNISSFFAHTVNKEGLRNSLKERATYKTPRKMLTETLSVQYENYETSKAVLQNIELLGKETTFTVTTAHQPNIFTGPLYFLYKILHAIKLAAYCKQEFPEYDFVPVYYMGSEDADLDELGHIYINGEKLSWDTQQTGAVGRMLVDKALLSIINKISGEVGVHPFGNEIISIISTHYKVGSSIQDATLGLVNELFGKYGLIVLIPDTPALKRLTYNIFKEELLKGHSSSITEETGKKLNAAGYHAQAHSREINFFYLLDDKRNRIEKQDVLWKVVDSELSFTEEQLLQELAAHPERFSPNVILRGIFQESILPNIAFIGGGGELAYWLQLKELFNFYKVPYPMLILRNSFLIINEKQKRQQQQLDFSPADIFQPTQSLQNIWTKEHTKQDLNVDAAVQELKSLYTQLCKQAESIDTTLLQHVESLKVNAEKRIKELGKKMLRAEKRKHTDSLHRIERLKLQLFPHDNLQERMDNFIPYYAKYGRGFIDELFKNSLALDQEFVVLEEG